MNVFDDHEIGPRSASELSQKASKDLIAADATIDEGAKISARLLRNVQERPQRSRRELRVTRTPQQADLFRFSLAKCSMSAVLPMPASPPTSTTAPRLELAANCPSRASRYEARSKSSTREC
jgi:hypothetical protein